MHALIHSVPWLLTAILYTPVLIALYFSRWEYIDYTHAYFILPLSLLVVYTKRGELARLAAGPANDASIAGLITLISGCLMLIFGWRQDYLMIESASLLFVLAGLSLFLYGKEMFRALLFPICYLALMIPPPLGILDAVTLPMRHLTSTLAAGSLDLIGFDVTRQGLLIYLGSHEIYMGEPCSGFRSLITMLSLGIIYTYFLKGSPLKNILMVSAIIPFALLGNFVRVVALCLITYYFGKETGEGFFHNFSGYVVFLVMISLLMAWQKFLEGRKI